MGKLYFYLLRTVFAAVRSVESPGVDIVERVDGRAVPEQSLHLSTGLAVSHHPVSVYHVQLPQVVVLYALDLPTDTPRRPDSRLSRTQTATSTAIIHSERNCADTIGTVLVPWAGRFQIYPVPPPPKRPPFYFVNNSVKN